MGFLQGTLTALLMVAFPAAALAQRPAKPNIVIILADDLGYGDVRCYNPQSQAKTPHIDALASRGMRFVDAHTPSAVCSPTRYSLLTGTHPFRVKLANRVQFDYDDVWIDADRRTLGNILRDNGYTTAMIGKWHLGYNVYDDNGDAVTGRSTERAIRPAWERGIANGPFDRGFDYAFGLVASADIPPYKLYENDQWVTTNAVWTRGKAEFNTDLLRAGYRDPDWHPNQLTRRLRDKAVSLIESQFADDQPFFLYLSLPSPHTPTAPHPDFQGVTPHTYTDFVTEVDDVVGSVVAALEARGWLDDTLIIFTSDNGASLRWARHETPPHHPNGFINGVPLRGQKADAWEGGHRVPFIVRWGDGTTEGSHIRPGSVSHELTNLLDIARTIAQLTGSTLRPDEAVDSWNMLPTWLGDGSDQRIREAQFSTSVRAAFAITQKDNQGNAWKLIFSDGSGQGFSAPKGSVMDPREPITDWSQYQLYNLAEDIGEQNNLLASGDAAMRRRAEQMRKLLVCYIESGRSAPVR